MKGSRYPYKLDGYEQQWTDYHDTYGGATYQLPAGSYTFLFNRAKPAGGWEPQLARLLILVELPLWKTRWFVSLVILIIGGGIIWLVRNRNRRRKLREELDRQAFEAKTLRELDELKSRFFANVTHELLTPLTIILNATEQLTESSLASSDQKRVYSIERNTHQLLRLINEALDFAKIDAGKLDRRPQIGDPLAFVEQVVAQFQDLATSRQISLSWVADAPVGEPWRSLYQFDGEKLEKITYNLLANALKFTFPEGTVRIEGAIGPEPCFVLRVTDTGIGIPAD